MTPRMRAALRWPATPPAAPSRASFLSATGWVVLSVAVAFTVGVAVTPIAYWQGYGAGQREADEDAVYAAVRDAIRVGTKVAGLQDTVTTLRRAMAADAAKRLPKRILDSLRNARWTTPDTTKGTR